MELRREELLVYRKSTTLLQTFKQFRRRIVSAEACGLRFYYYVEHGPFLNGFVNLAPDTGAGIT